jgi:hypothetical protein
MTRTTRELAAQALSTIASPDINRVFRRIDVKNKVKPSVELKLIDASCL